MKMTYVVILGREGPRCVSRTSSHSKCESIGFVWNMLWRYENRWIWSPSDWWVQSWECWELFMYSEIFPWSCTSQWRYLCKVELGCDTNDLCLTMGLIPNDGLDPWWRGGRLSGFESHMTKDTLSGSESHISDDSWSEFESHGKPLSTRKSNHMNMLEPSLTLDVVPTEEWCFVDSK